MLLPPCITLIHAKTLSFLPPNGWNQIDKMEVDDKLTISYLPEGEDNNSWTQKITLVHLQNNSDEAMLNLVQSTLQPALLACLKPPLRRGRFHDDISIENGYIAETACDNVDTSNTKETGYLKNELMRLFVLQRTSGIYMLKYSWHDTKSSARSRFDDPAQLNKFRRFISELR